MHIFLSALSLPFLTHTHMLLFAMRTFGFAFYWLHALDVNIMKGLQ